MCPCGAEPVWCYCTAHDSSWELSHRELSQSLADDSTDLFRSIFLGDKQGSCAIWISEEHEPIAAGIGQRGQSLKPRDGSPISIRDATVAPPIAGSAAAAIQRPMPQSAAQSGLQQPAASQQQLRRPYQVQPPQPLQPQQQASLPQGQPLQGAGGPTPPLPQPQQQQARPGPAAPPASSRPVPAAARPTAPVYVVPPHPGAAKLQEEMRRGQALKAAAAAVAGADQAAAQEAPSGLRVNTAPPVVRSTEVSVRYQ